MMIPVRTTATTVYHGYLKPGEDTLVCLYLKLEAVNDPSLLDSAWTNYGEISKAYDTTGLDVSLKDIDGPLNNNPYDNAGGKPESPADDSVKGNGTGAPGDGVDTTDSDSHDPALGAIRGYGLEEILRPIIHSTVFDRRHGQVCNSCIQSGQSAD